jgi:hypothetical protein
MQQVTPEFLYVFDKSHVTLNNVFIDKYLCIATFYIELYDHAILDYLRAVFFGATADKLDFTRARCLHKNST